MDWEFGPVGGEVSGARRAERNRGCKLEPFGDAALHSKKFPTAAECSVPKSPK